MKTKIFAKVSGSLHKTGFQLKKHSPEILMTAGVVGVVASLVTACKATLKVKDILDEKKSNLESIQECSVDETLAESYTKEDIHKDTTLVYVQTGVKLAKLYAPTAIICVLSLTAIIQSHHILHDRSAALAAAYATIDQSYKAYRRRVAEKYGDEAERAMRYDIRENEIVNESTGEVETVQSVSSPDDFSRFFDEYSPYWSKDAEYNLFFLRSRENFANDKLKAQGYLFLNDVYDMLGIARTKAGQIIGWIYDPKDESRANYVDFGISEENENCLDRSYLLDFNVDGDIWHKMPEVL